MHKHRYSTSIDKYYTLYTIIKYTQRKFAHNSIKLNVFFLQNLYFKVTICEIGAVIQPPNCRFSNYLNKSNCNLQFHPITQGDVAQITGSLKPKTSTGIEIYL